jgi:hypothetical protein
MQSVEIRAGNLVKGYSTSPGRGCSEFALHVAAVISRQGVTSLVGVQMNGRFEGELTSRRADRIVPFDLTVEDGEGEVPSLDEVYITRPDSRTAYVEDVSDKPRKKMLVTLCGGEPIHKYVVDSAAIEVADADDLAFLEAASDDAEPAQ